MLILRYSRGRWDRLRHGPRDVSAQLPVTVTTCNGGWNSRAWLLPLEFDGQFRMGRRIHKSFWTALCRLRDAKKNAETQCTVLQRGDNAKRSRVIYSSRNKSSRIEQVRK